MPVDDEPAADPAFPSSSTAANPAFTSDPATPSSSTIFAAWNQAKNAADVSEVLRVLRQLAKAEDEPLVHQRLALLLVQSGAITEAEALLRQLGMTHRLALRCFLPPAAGTAVAASGSQPGGDTVHAVDAALPEPLFARLQAAFGTGSSFWAEHDYHSPETGYFSYVEPLQPPQGATLVGRAVRAMRDLAAAHFPEAAEAAHAEWWAHLKPFHAGTELHFDSADAAVAEGRGAARDGLACPLVSGVLYLSAVGGPTLVTDLAFGGGADEGATSARLVRPVPNRALFFRGDLLHGVAPGARPAGGAPRLTLMVALWRRLRACASPSPGEPLRGGMAPPPPLDGGLAWPRRLLAPEPEAIGEAVTEPEEAAAKQAVGVELVRPLWVPLAAGKRPRDDAPGTPPAPVPSMARCFEGSTPWKV